MTTRRTRSSVQRKLVFGNPSETAVIHDDDDEIEEQEEEEIDDGVAATTSKKKTAGKKGAGFLAGSSPTAKRRKKEKSSSSSSRDAGVAASQKTPSRPTITHEKSAVVTPADEYAIKQEKKAQKQKQKTPAEYVPTYIHKNVEYDRLGQRSAADHNNQVHKTVLECYHWIAAHCDIPADLEQNRRYGPLSGTCYEERAVRAYRLGLIVPQNRDDAPQLCTSCAKLGHAYDACPSMV